mgnify:CR=1 FL=1
MNDVSTVPLWLIVLIVVLVVTQGTSLFVDARKRGLGKWAWFWGIWGSTTFPLPLLLYVLLVVRRQQNGK